MLAGVGLLGGDGLCALSGDYQGYPRWYTGSLLAAKLLTGVFGSLWVCAGIGRLRRQGAVAVPAAGYWLLMLSGVLYASGIPLLVIAYVAVGFSCDVREEYGSACDVLFGDYLPFFVAVIAGALVGLAGVLTLLWAFVRKGRRSAHATPAE